MLNADKLGRAAYKEESEEKGEISDESLFDSDLTESDEDSGSDAQGVAKEARALKGARLINMG
jgi:hypothetical protein